MTRLARTISGLSGQSWADMLEDEEAPELCESHTVSEDTVSEDQPDAGSAELPSVGSVNHSIGRCKPCVFFHTKGCQNDKECTFCHLCPPLEKQRRKRLRERMNEKIRHGEIAPNQAYAESQRFFNPYYQMEPGFKERQQKPRHLRQASGASTVSTQSNCSGWFSHSRQSSGSSGTPSTADIGMSPPSSPESRKAPSTHRLAAAPSPHHQAMPKSDTSAFMPNSCGSAPMNGHSVMGTMIDRGDSQYMSMPSDQMLVGNVVFVPVSVPMPVDMPTQPNFVDQSMTYGCFSQQCQSPMEAMHCNQEQWFYSVPDFDTRQMGTTATWNS